MQDSATAVTGPRRQIPAIVGMMLVAFLLLALLIGKLSAHPGLASEPAGAAAWNEVFREDFESGVPAGWVITDQDVSIGGDYYWSTTSHTSSEGTTSAWATGGGAFVDNVVLESLAEPRQYLPLLRKEPTPTPSPTPTPIPVYYFDDFSDDDSGWPIVYNPDPLDWFHWYYENGTYRLDIGDDRTDVKASPGVELPSGDYVIEADGRFSWYDPNVLNYWTSYGIIFDGKDDPDPANPDLGDYFMLWVLFEGPSKAKWTILNDMTGPGNSETVGGWRLLSGAVYNYGDSGLEWNHWKIVRAENSISVYCNGVLLETLSCGPYQFNCVRPRDNYQVLLGLYGSTYETNRASFSWDNYLVQTAGARVGSWNLVPRGPIVTSGASELEQLLPHRGE